MLVTLKSLGVKGEVYSNFYLSYGKVYKTSNFMGNLRLQIILILTKPKFSFKYVKNSMVDSPF